MINLHEKLDREYNERKAKSIVAFGTIFKSNWYHGQSNPAFFEVVDCTPSGKSIIVRQLATSVVESTETYDMIVPNEYSYISDITQYRVSKANDKYGFRVGYNEYAFEWNGKPAHKTNSGYGH